MKSVFVGKLSPRLNSKLNILLYRVLFAAMWLIGGGAPDPLDSRKNCTGLSAFYFFS